MWPMPMANGTRGAKNESIAVDSFVTELVGRVARRET